ncbi:general secretion pathway protein GspN [Pseudomonas sp. RIT-To-2]|uniref:general secretion pathway protein GspN n=1 Tax=Pseudomonas sp. RIT-To-2 TaxID=3462541 RepID=UPI002413AAB1
MTFMRSTLGLACLNGLLLAAVAWQCLGGEPAPRWAPVAQHSPPPVKAVPVPALLQLPDSERQVAWQHPLFSPDRQADAARGGAGAPTLDGVRLSGVVVDGDQRWALVRLANQRSLKLRLGDALDSGWTLAQVSATTATFQRQGQAHTLNLPVPRLPATAAAPLLTLPHVAAP